MKLNLDTGTIITGIAMVIFYLRLMQIRGKRLKQANQGVKDSTRKERKEKGLQGGKQSELKKINPKKVSFQVANWWLASLGILLMCAGLALKTSSGLFSDWLPANVLEYWWIGTSLGPLLWVFCFK